MKKLKFSPNLVSLILKGEKTATWRLWDDKDLQTGDVVEFVNFETGELFAKAILTRVITKPFKDLEEQDKYGHEKYGSDKELFEMFEKYYGKPVEENTPFKIIWFQLIDPSEIKDK